MQFFINSMVNKFFFCGIPDLVHKAFIVEKKNLGDTENIQKVIIYTVYFSFFPNYKI
jgi:hypothetical protein